MRSLGRTKDGVEVREVDVRAEILEALQVVRNQLTQRAVVVYDAEGALPFVRAVPGELSRVFLNILVNASHAIPTGRVPENRITVGARESGEELVVEIADTGKGMTPEVRGRIFEPFFTTKPVGEGTGLGLAIARSIVEGAGGRIEVESEVGRGSVFRIRLPVAWKDQPGSADRADAASGVEPGGETTRLRVLIIDDEPMVAHSLVRDLEASADADVAYSAADALLRIDAGGEWDAVLCDLMMPAMDGIAFHQLLATRHPAWLGRVVFMTGGAFGERAERFVMDPGVVVIAKPAQRAHLIGALEEAARKGRGAGGEDAARAMPA
jgi:two-component system cell cycle sensor histidine kinase/response regulator CckA